MGLHGCLLCGRVIYCACGGHCFGAFSAGAFWGAFGLIAWVLFVGAFVLFRGTPRVLVFFWNSTTRVLLQKYFFGCFVALFVWYGCFLWVLAAFCTRSGAFVHVQLVARVFLQRYHTSTHDQSTQAPPKSTLPQSTQVPPMKAEKHKCLCAYCLHATGARPKTLSG